MGDRSYLPEALPTTPNPREGGGPVLGRPEALARWPTVQASVMTPMSPIR